MKDRINKPVEAKKDKLQALKDFSDEEMRKHGPMHWILDESGEATPASLMEWSLWYQKSRQRVIQQDYTDNHKVSTVFVGIDLGYGFFNPEHKPLVFETMVLGPEREIEWFNGKKMMTRPGLWTERCSTLAEAKEMHRRGQEWLEKHLKKTP